MSETRAASVLPVSYASMFTRWQRNMLLYYYLAKPGIVYSNTLTAVAGYVFATRWHVHILVLLSLTIGTMFLIASACICNNYIDRRLDMNMGRTRTRALVTGVLSGRQALYCAGVIGILGLGVLYYTNWLTVAIGLGAVASYVVLYGIAKRYTAHGTLVGTLPGAASLVAGYTAATGRLDFAAFLLFIIMLAWQMPHFYAIAIRHKDDYAAAGLPVWPVRHGEHSTARQMVVYCGLFILAICMLTVFQYTGYIFAIIMVALGLRWYWLAMQGLHATSSAWARKAFFFSLIVLLAFTVMLPLGVLLP